MISSRSAALLAAALLGLSLWLRPVVGRLGGPPEEIRGPVRSDGAPAASREIVVATAPSRHLDAAARAIFEATNVERRRAGLRPLVEEPRLAEIATAHCDDMLTRRFFDHVNPDGEGPADRVARGHRRMIGTSAENIWTGTGFDTEDPQDLARQIVRSWMGSAGHRENILRPELTHLGVGVSASEEELRAAQLFGRVRGYLEEDLPASLRRESSPRLAFLPFGGEPTPERIDLFADGRPRWGPEPVTGARLDVGPGSYRTRFYLPRAPGEYVIAYGPEVRVER